MYGYKIFLAWLCTVVLGSIGLPIGFQIIETSGRSWTVSDHLDETIRLMFLCMLVSALCSLPTVIVLLVRNGILNTKKYAIKKHLRKINLTHLFMAFLTLLTFQVFIFMDAASGYNGIQSYDLVPMLGITAVIVWYMICALPIWFLFFRKDIKGAQAEAKNESTAILDNI